MNSHTAISVCLFLKYPLWSNLMRVGTASPIVNYLFLLATLFCGAHSAFGFKYAGSALLCIPDLRGGI